ncbi:MAG: hypothetical protein B7Z37_23105 [Verrucomicrobia bacterium 12-59-8]|nr:MAG: hypothetical protein B7Z37_23105 [Verrucomicrobia bacterium 12-59-8]
MIQLNASFFSSRFFKSSLWLMLGLLLGFWMDYSNGRRFGMDIAFDLTGPEKYLVLAVSFCACLFFNRKKKRKSFHDGMFFRHDVKALASLVIMGFFSYCHLLPSTVRNTAFKWGITSILRDYPGDAAILRKLLIEEKPHPTKALPSFSILPGMAEKWQTDLRPLEMVYSGRCNTLVFKGHFRYVVAVFLESVDEATAKQIIAEDNSRIPCFEGRRVFSTTAYGVTLVWEDIT